MSSTLPHTMMDDVVLPAPTRGFRLDFSAVTERQIFWGMITLAAALRFAAAIPFAVNWFDEIWQYLEPAWHIVEGPWIQTWDFRFGIRSWLMPELVAAPMALGRALAPDTSLHLFLPRLMFAAFSLTIVGAAMALGFRISRLHGIMAGFVTAVWFELVYFGPRILADTFGLALFMGAVWVLMGRRDAPGPRQFALAGLLMGLCFIVRIQYAPALLILTIFTARTAWRTAWLPMILGGLGALCIDAAANLAMGQTPFFWMYEAIRMNVVEGRADSYGVFPIWGYFAFYIVHWSLLFLPVTFLTWLGGRQYPVLLWIGIAHLASHSLIGHKEYRFVALSTAIFIILASFGVATLLQKLPAHRRTAATLGTMLFIALASATLSLGQFRFNWSTEQGLAQAMEKAGKPDDTCGLAVFMGRDSVSASYALYRRATPIYKIDTVTDARAQSRAFNVMVTEPRNVVHAPSEYRVEFCGDPGRSQAPACVLRRAGSCNGADARAYEYNNWLIRTDN